VGSLTAVLCLAGHHQVRVEVGGIDDISLLCALDVSV